MTTKRGRLATAADAAEASEWKKALGALVAEWRVAKSPAIAELVAAIDRIVAAPPIEKATVKARETAWELLAIKHDESVLPTLLATPWPVHPGDAIVRIGFLEEHPPSPRITHALVALVERKQYPSAAGRKVARRIFRHLIAQNDPLAHAYIARLDAETTVAARHAREALGALINKRRISIPIHTADELASIARISACVTPTIVVTSTHDDLVEGVYAAPFDDAPREVLADALAEAGDPRGELVMLQLRRHRGDSTPRLLARERALLREAGNKWYAGLDDDGAREIEFARGFPVKATTQYTKFEAPGWSTIETLSINTMGAQDVVRSSRLGALRVLSGVRALNVAQLQLPNPAQLEDLAVQGIDGLAAEVPFAPTSFGLDRIAPREVVQCAAAVIGWPIGRRVTHVHIPSTIDGLWMTFAILRAVAQIERVSILGHNDRFFTYPGMWSAEVTRDHLKLVYTGGGYNDVTAVLATLGTLENPGVSTIEIVATQSKTTRLGHDKVRKAVTKLAKSWGAKLLP